MELTHISLFSGAVDGIGIAAKKSGFKNIILCEKDEYCRKVLRKNNPDSIIYDDVVTMPHLPHATLLSAGIPCQQHASVNKEGNGDDFEWMHTRSRIKESKPKWIIIENVDGIKNTIHDKICTELETDGYEVETYNIPAIAFGAHHQRYRIFIVANSCSKPIAQTNTAFGSFGDEWYPWKNDMRSTWGSLSGTYWGSHQPPVCGMANGITTRFYKDRMKALGNCVVWQQVYPIVKGIQLIELMISQEIINERN